MPSGANDTPPNARDQDSWSSGDTFDFLRWLPEHTATTREYAVAVAVAVHLNGDKKNGRNGTAWPRLQVIADSAHVSLSTARRLIPVLVERGVLRSWCGKCRRPRGECAGGRGHRTVYAAGERYARGPHDPRTTPAQTVSELDTLSVEDAPPKAVSTNLNSVKTASCAPPHPLKERERISLKTRADRAQTHASSDFTEKDESPVSKRRQLRKAVGGIYAADAEEYARVMVGRDDVDAAMDGLWRYARRVGECWASSGWNRERQTAHRARCRFDEHGAAAYGIAKSVIADARTAGKAADARKRTATPDPVFADPDANLEQTKRAAKAALQEHAAQPAPVSPVPRPELEAMVAVFLADHYGPPDRFYCQACGERGHHPQDRERHPDEFAAEVDRRARGGWMSYQMGGNSVRSWVWPHAERAAEVGA